MIMRSLLEHFRILLENDLTTVALNRSDFKTVDDINNQIDIIHQQIIKETDPYKIADYNSDVRLLKQWRKNLIGDNNEN